MMVRHLLIGTCLFATAIIQIAQSSANEASTAHAEFLTSASAGGNAFYVKATGDIEHEGVYTIADRSRNQEIFWECSAKALRVGFASGQMMKPDWETLVLLVEEPVSSGQTGKFPMSGIQWTNGQERMAGQPADSPFKVPRNFEGNSGELELSRHVATSRSARRIQGSAKGQVKSKNGDLTVQLHVEFDLKKAC